MYAVIETGGKQYTVELGTELEVELLDAEPGKEIKLERVLLVADGDNTVVGQPIVKGAAVSAEVLRRDRGEKLISFKYRPKARRRVKKGHRQELTVLKITDVRLGSKSAAAQARAAEEAAAEERGRIEKAATKQAAEDAALAAKLRTRARGGESAEKDTAKTEKTDKAAAKPTTRAKTESKAEKPAKAEPKTEGSAEDEAPAKRSRTKKDE